MPADPGSLEGALASGILGCGTVLLGTSELCGKLLTEAMVRVAAGEDADAVAHDLVRRIRAAAEGCRDSVTRSIVRSIRAPNAFSSSPTRAG